MSRPPPPPPPQLPSSSSAMAMTETQNLPNFPPPPFLGHPYRRLPQPVQLPPLSIPPASVRPDYPSFVSPASHQLPSIHSLPPARPSHSRSAAPVDKLLSNNPYTPPRHDLHYPNPVSPRPDRALPRRMPERFAAIEDPRLPPLPSANPPPPPPPPPPTAPQAPQPPQRPAYQPVLSPAYTPSYAPSTTSFRGSIDSHRSSAASSFGPPVTYPDPPAPVPAQRPPPPPISTVACAGPIAAPSAPFHGPVQDKNQHTYELIVRQQPIAARACGFGERDRRVIDPPPIIQLRVTDPRTGATDQDELRYSLNVVHCTLWNADGTSEETALIQPDRRTTRRLMGQLVASPSVAKDEHDVEGCFFCFPDLSCRTHGRYRLRFILMRIDPVNLHVGGLMPILTEVLSDVFTVYTAKDFPGMRPSSALTRALKLQGCNIQVKKGNEKALARRRASAISEEDDQGDGDTMSNSGRKRRRE